MKKLGKKIVIITIIVIIGFSMAACGRKCPGGGNSGGSGNCQFTFDPANPLGGLVQRYCEDLSCAAYNKALEFINNPSSFTSKVTVTCDCH